MSKKSGVSRAQSEIKPNIERRLWKRFKVDGAFASVPRPSLIRIIIGKNGQRTHSKLGPIKDISMKGLAVQYIESKKVPESNDMISIMMPGEGVIVEDIKFKAVRDFEVGRLPRSTRKIRTLCVSFKKLLPTQKSKLEYFIEKYGNELKK